MSQTQDTAACIHNSSEKKLTQVEHDKVGLLPLVMLCPECISFFESAYFFKIIPIDTIPDIEPGAIVQ